MKKLILLFLLFSLNALAILPPNLPNFSNINSILFREIKDHMFQVLAKSRLYDFSNGCRVYKFSNNSSTDKDLVFCLKNTLKDNLITQQLSVQVDHQFAGSFIFIQEGVSPTPLSFDEFINFRILPPKKGYKSSFFFDHSTFGLIIDRRKNQETLKAFLQIDDFKIDILEDGVLNNRYRNYLLSCGDCEGVTWLKVQEEEEANLRYFSGASPSEVTPAHFNQFIKYFIIFPMTQLGTQLKDTLILELNWPDLN